MLSSGLASFPDWTWPALCTFLAALPVCCSKIRRKEFAAPSLRRSVAGPQLSACKPMQRGTISVASFRLKAAARACRLT